MRGEKRPASTQLVMTENGGHLMANGINEPPAKKVAADRLPEFDWAANNYELTWKLVEQLRKEEHKKVVFPEHEIPRNHPGDTKEDVYRRIAQTIVYDVYVQDPVVCTSRMKNKTVAMWKDYSNHTRKLIDVCQKNQYELTGNAPADTAPADVKELWKNICLMMPVYPTLRTFMPIRPEEKKGVPTSSSSKAKPRPPRASSAQDTNGVTTRTVSVPLPTAGPSIGSSTSDNAMSDTTMEQSPYTPGFSPPITPLTVEEYLAIRKSYQEDVRLGIFTAKEARAKIEELDKARRVSELSHTPSSLPGTPSASAPHSLQPPPPASTPPIVQPSLNPTEEAAFEEKALELGFRKPTSSSPFMRMSYKEFFKLLLEHSAECELVECRLDSRRRPPRLDFIPGPQYTISHSIPHHHAHGYAHHLDPTLSPLPTPTSSGSSSATQGITLALVTPSGPVPLSSHPPAASIRMQLRGAASVHGIAVSNLASFLPHVRFTAGGVLSSPESTIWDHADAVVQAAQQRRLSYEELQILQSRLPSVQFVNREGVTLFNILCLEARQPRHNHNYSENGCIIWT